MPRRNEPNPNKRPVEQYDHKGKKRLNNPPVGLVDASTDAVEGRKTHTYDPHLDPQLAGRARRSAPASRRRSSRCTSTSASIRAASSRLSARRTAPTTQQLSLFAAREQNLPLREAIDFYKHAHNWSNRLIAGDSLLVMNSLIEKEGMAGKV